MRTAPIRAAAALATMLLATSCASDHGEMTFQEDKNYPIAVEPQFAKLDLAFTTPAAGLMAEDEARLRRFAAAYLDSGNGQISIVAPQGADSAQTIRYFGDKLAALGVPQSRILVGTDAAIRRVELRFIVYRTSVAACGNYGDVAHVADNMPMDNLGCSIEHNLAAMVSDPRDLIAPRPLGPADAAKRNDAQQKYEAGQPTSAIKTNEQKSQISDVTSQ